MRYPKHVRNTRQSLDKWILMHDGRALMWQSYCGSADIRRRRNAKHKKPNAKKINRNETKSLTSPARIEQHVLFFISQQRRSRSVFRLRPVECACKMRGRWGWLCYFSLHSSKSIFRQGFPHSGALLRAFSDSNVRLIWWDFYCTTTVLILIVPKPVYVKMIH